MSALTSEVLLKNRYQLKPQSPELGWQGEIHGCSMQYGLCRSLEALWLWMENVLYNKHLFQMLCFLLAMCCPTATECGPRVP